MVLTPKELDDPLKRPCPLCGKPFGKHVAPPYGQHSDKVGAMGLMCPTDTRIDEIQATADDEDDAHPYGSACTAACGWCGRCN